MKPFAVDVKQQTFVQAGFCRPSREERKIELCVNRVSHWISRTLNRRPCGINCHFLLYCVNGKGEVSIGKRKFAVSRGDLVVVPAHTDSRMADDPTVGWDIYWIHFSGSYAEHLAKWVGFSANRPVLTHGVHQDTIDRFEGILNHLTKIKTDYVYAAAQELLGIFLGAKHSSDEGGTAANELSAGLSWQTRDMKELVRAAHCSASHYIRKFKRAYGISPWQYVLNLKVDKAKSLLLDPSLSVKDVASRLGFAHASHFSRLFKRIVGQSPNAFRMER